MARDSDFFSAFSRGFVNDVLHKSSAESSFTVDDLIKGVGEMPLAVTNSLLGIGAFGVVCEGLLGTKHVAVKYQALPDEEMLLNALCAELTCLKNFEHASLLRFHGAMVSPPPLLQQDTTSNLPFAADDCSRVVAMVTEAAREGSLELLVVRAARRREAVMLRVEDPNSSFTEESNAAAEEVLPWELRVRIMKEVASGLTFLHSKGIIHRGKAFVVTFMSASTLPTAADSISFLFL